MSGTSTSVANMPLGSYPVRRRETSNGQIQVVSLDIGDGVVFRWHRQKRVCLYNSGLSVGAITIINLCLG